MSMLKSAGLLLLSAAGLAAVLHLIEAPIILRVVMGAALGWFWGDILDAVNGK